MDHPNVSEPQICIAHAVWLRVKVVDVEIPNGRADAAAISVAVKTYLIRESEVKKRGARETKY